MDDIKRKYIKLGKYASGCIYWYNDDPNICYFSNLKVNDNEKGKGYGNRLLLTLEKIGIKSGSNTAMLWVKTESWMHNWYKRHGFKDYQIHDDPEYIWMYKDLINK